MYVVTLVKDVKGIFRTGFFPHKVRYLEDAERLAKEVKSYGGEAKIVKEVRGIKARDTRKVKDG